MNITNDELRDLAPMLKRLEPLAETIAKESVTLMPGFAVLDHLTRLANAAALADPSCFICGGSGEVTLFAHDDDDPQEHPCPECRPWPSGFTGWRDPIDGHTWVVAPYGPGESTRTMREVKQP